MPDTPPAINPIALDIVAVTGGKPSVTRIGNVTRVPEPTSVLIAPAHTAVPRTGSGIDPAVFTVRDRGPDREASAAMGILDAPYALTASGKHLCIYIGSSKSRVDYLASGAAAAADFLVMELTRIGDGRIFSDPAAMTAWLREFDLSWAAQPEAVVRAIQHANVVGLFAFGSTSVAFTQSTLACLMDALANLVAASLDYYG